MNAPRELDTSAIDERHPWLGLASFSEETRGYFYGREEEVGELSRRIQRKLLTVLFGQSGLGKTSILRAGIVPRLREQGYCPVYVRVDYGPDAPPAAVQIKQAILRATAEAGQWSHAGVAAEGESLWEFLHHRDDMLADSDGKILMPLLIFDQFEEIFTLAQSDDGGRERAARFIDGLAELVENRPSAALEAQLEEDDTAVERYDFARSDYRVLIALREDYLAHLEGLKGPMPSITQNRMRLAPMTGGQALSAVRGPGGALITDEVAEAIVRFVAGGSELAHAQVEPSLLSLICRELNDKRIAAEREAITMDLLAGSHASILSDFYERAVADQPEAVRSVIEDVLLTDSGYRENVAEERVRAALAAAGATPDALAKLVDRRLLRIEDRLDVRRVELTHDVLCGVVGQSRAQRQEREAHAATARNLAEQEAAARAARKALVRARQVSVGCIVLTVCAVGSAGFGYLNMKQAQATREMSDASRAGAEKLVGYLQDEFYDELAPIGRTDMLSDLATQTAAYYRGLPPAMRNTGTAVGLGTALLQLGAVRLQEGKQADSVALYDEAIATLTPVSASVKTEALQLALAKALMARSRVDYLAGEHAKSSQMTLRAIALTAPYATMPGASIAARRVYATQRRTVGYTKLRAGDFAGARIELQAARDVASDQGAMSSNIALAISYLEATSWLHEAWARGLGKDLAIANRFAQEALAGSAKVLEDRPNHAALKALQGRVQFILGYTAFDQRRQAHAQEWFQQHLEGDRERLRNNPKNLNIYDGLAISYGFLQMSNARQGRPADAQRYNAQIWQLYEHVVPVAYQSGNLSDYARSMALLDAELGEPGALDSMVKRMHHHLMKAYEKYAEDLADLPAFMTATAEFDVNVTAGRPQASSAAAADLIGRGEQLLAKTGTKGATAYAVMSGLIMVRSAAAQLAIANADFQSAERHSLAALALTSGVADFDDGDLNVLHARHALALARLKRYPEAVLEANLSLKQQRALLAGSDDQMLRFEMAQTLYALALAKAGTGGAEMKEAATLLAKLPPAMQGYRSVKLWRARLANEH